MWPPRHLGSKCCRRDRDRSFQEGSRDDLDGYKMLQVVGCTMSGQTLISLQHLFLINYSGCILSVIGYTMFGKTLTATNHSTPIEQSPADAPWSELQHVLTLHLCCQEPWLEWGSFSIALPWGNDKHSYWKWPFIVSWQWKMDHLAIAQWFS